MIFICTVETCFFTFAKFSNIPNCWQLLHFTGSDIYGRTLTFWYPILMSVGRVDDEKDRLKRPVSVLTFVYKFHYLFNFTDVLVS